MLKHEIKILWTFFLNWGFLDRDGSGEIRTPILLKVNILNWKYELLKLLLRTFKLIWLAH